MSKYRYITILILLCGSSSIVHGQLKADFSAIPMEGCAPLFVEFHDLSSGSAVKWIWELGNNTIAEVKNPTTTYFATGIYTIKLKIFDAAGDSSEMVKSQFIKVTTTPEVDFATNKLEGCAPFNVNFKDLSDAKNGIITKWDWDFGDGNVAQVQNPAHLYKSSGIYNVTLKVTNNNGCISFLTKKSYIKVDQKPVADFTSNFTTACSAPATINFIDNAKGGGPFNYKWDFGDNKTGSEKNPVHIYGALGKYNVSLIVTNQFGCADTIKKPNYIYLGTIKASFSAPSLSCINVSINFKSTTQPTPQSIFWDFGDGTNSTLENPSKIFANGGIYSVKMVIRTQRCADSIIKQITIKDSLSLDFKASPLITCKAPLTVNFTNLTPGDNNYTWQFGDNATANSKNPSHTYTRDGNYSVKLIGNYAPGCSDSLTKNIIHVGLPVVKLNLPAGGCVPFTHQFSASFTPAFQIQNYKWNFGDGNTSTAATPIHQYKKQGNYFVSLIYTTSEGCIDTVKVENGIKVGSPPTANFKANPLNACAKEPIKFTDLSTNVGDSIAWNWDFGDGGTSILQNPQYIYKDTGKFNVKLIIINNGCADSLFFKKYIHIDPPIAAFIFKQTCNTSGHIQFTDKSIGADTWLWDFGDGNTANDKSPVHDYAHIGAYTVSLTVTNNKTGCSYTKQSAIQVIEETPDFTSDISEVCKNMPVNFLATNVNIGNIKSYTWNFGDGTSKDFKDTSAVYKYALAGEYDVSLTIKDNNNCNTTVTKKVFIKIVGPTPLFHASDPIVCKNEVVTFIDSSYTYGSGNILNWEWNFGDGSTKQNLKTTPFIHKYTDSGFYSISLKVTDERGCIDSITKKKEVRVPYVKAAFSLDSLSCTYQQVNFKNLSVGEGLTYLWDFGDSLTENNAVVSHNYSKEGIYSASLSVEDVNGCKSETTQINAITIADPQAKFALNKGFSTCPPLIVQFENLSKSYSTYEWNFGDNTNSVLLNPSHFYGDVGTYKARLTVKGGRGCIDTDSSEIVVKGPAGSFTYDILKGCVPLVVHFKADTKFSDSARWDFNDGNSSTITQGIISHKYEVAGFFEPKLILKDREGCVVPLRGIDTIKVFGVVAAFSLDSNRICDSQGVQFYNKSKSNDRVVQYHWTFGVNSISEEENPIKIYDTPGVYNTVLSVITREGCKDTTRIISPITVKETPVVDIGGNDEVCVLSEIKLSGLVLRSDPSPISWKWDFGNGKTDVKQNPLLSYDSAGIYSAKAIASSANGCSDTAIKLINVYPLPDINISGKNVICLDKSTTISVTGAENYSWTPSASLSCIDCASLVASPEYSTQYKVRGVSDKGCISVDSIRIEVKRPFKMIVSNKKSLCVGETVQLSVNGAEKYHWTPISTINDATSPNPIVSPIDSITYRVIGQDSIGCFADTGYVPIAVFNYPKVNAGVDKTINVGSTITIIPVISSDATNIVWSPTSGILSQDEKGVVDLMPKQTTTYNIAVKNEGGCLALDKVTVFVLCNNANVFVPNTFSPNGDGINDVFYPHGTGVFKIKNLRIFNRWGQVVFERSHFMANDISGGWDGSFKGQELNPDVFVYMLTVICENNEILTFKGDVTLIR